MDLSRISLITEVFFSSIRPCRIAYRIKSWKVRLPNLAARNADMGRTTLPALNGENLSFENDNRPAARLLYYHLGRAIAQQTRPAAWVAHIPFFRRYLDHLFPRDILDRYINQSSISPRMVREPSSSHTSSP